MKVDISVEYTPIYKGVDLDNGVLVMDGHPDNLSGLVTVYGDGYRENYHNPTVVTVPSTDGRVHFKLVNPTPQAERIQNIEAAITELYELIIGG